MKCYESTHPSLVQQQFQSLNMCRRQAYMFWSLSYQCIVQNHFQIYKVYSSQLRTSSQKLTSLKQVSQTLSRLLWNCSEIFIRPGPKSKPSQTPLVQTDRLKSHPYISRKSLMLDISWWKCATSKWHELLKTWSPLAEEMGAYSPDMLVDLLPQVFFQISFPTVQKTEEPLSSEIGLQFSWNGDSFCLFYTVPP